jgi:hypothetical protein
MAGLGFPVSLGYPDALGTPTGAMETRAIIGSITLDAYDLNLPSGYGVILSNSWSLTNNKVSVQVNIYADENAYLAGANPISYISQSFDYENIIKEDFIKGLYTALLDIDLFASCSVI